MVNKTIKKTYSDIKSLKIQGATNIAVSALDSLRTAKNKKELSEAVFLFAESRPTEPLMRNGLRYVAFNVQQNYLFKKSLNFWIDKYLAICESAMGRIAEMGSRRIINNSRVMTFCHSSAVMAVLKKAKQKHRNFEVYLSETEPRHQGKISAKELASAGIKVKYMVDSAKGTYINDMDLVLVGADALTAEGNLVNKIGTADLAVLSREADVEFAVASELLKFDPMTIHGHPEPIEQRDPAEVWSKPPKGVTVLNPAFDITKCELIDFIITEQGIISPHNVLSTAVEKYPWLRR